MTRGCARRLRSSAHQVRRNGAGRGGTARIENLSGDEDFPRSRDEGTRRMPERIHRLPRILASTRIVDRRGVLGGNLLSRSDPGGSWRPARTGPDGSFELIGSGEKLTAWHGDFGASTVALSDAREIALPSKGSIRGRLLDRARYPLAGAAVILDRTQSTTTDARGRFAFEGVFAGVRGLQLDLPAPPSGAEPSRVARIGVLVKSGESVELELGANWIDGVVELESEGGEPFSGKAVLVGLDGICSFAELLFADGRAEIRDFLPGRYLLTSPHGPMALASIEGPYTKLALGQRDLTVSGTPGARLFLVVEGAHELAELLAARVSARPIPSSGVVRFEGLPPATWSVGVEGRGLLATIDVAEPGTKVQLP